MTVQKYFIKKIKIFFLLLFSNLLLTSNFCIAQSHRLKEITINGLNSNYLDFLKKI